MSFLARVVPPAGIARSLAVQTGIYSIGAGLFASGSVVYFTRVVGLSALQVGLGLSVAGLVSMALTVPAGMVADRVGSRRAWLIAIFVEASFFAGYLVVRNFVGFILVVIGISTVAGMGSAGRGNYTMEIAPADQRVMILAHQRAAVNAGYSVGAGLAALALWVDARPAYLALPLGYIFVLLINASLVWRLPKPQHRFTSRAETRRIAAVFTDRPFLSACAVNAVLSMHAVLIGLVVPLWTLARTDAPRPLIAVLVLVNTVCVILFQVPLSRGGDDLPGGKRALRRSGLVLAAGCAAVATTSASQGALTIAMLIVAILLITAGEMLQATGMWSILAHVPPPEHRGQYQGAMRMATQLQHFVSATAIVALTMWSSAGWLLLAGLLAAAAMAVQPLMASLKSRSVER